MKVQKYVSDYGLENIETKNGKLKTVSVYKGKYFRFERDDLAYPLKKDYIISDVLLIILLFLSMLLTCNNLRVWYVNMPYYLTMFTTLSISDAVVRFSKYNGKMIREDAEKIPEKIAIGSFLGIFFCIISLIGSIYALITFKTPSLNDWIFILIVILSISLNVHIFVRKGILKTVEIE